MDFSAKPVRQRLDDFTLPGLNAFFQGGFFDNSGTIHMKLFCILSTIALTIAFLLLNLFLPLALLIFAAAIGLGIYCGVIRSPGKKECRQGPC